VWQKGYAERLLVHSSTVLYDALHKNDETKLIFYALRFLHFWNIPNQPDRADKNGDRLEMRSLFDVLIDNYAKFYSPSKHLAGEQNEFAYS
jgi:hypothetical protein